MSKDFIRPFLLSEGLFRGNVVKISDAVKETVRRKSYPLPVAALLAETQTAAALMSSALKYDGVFTLQIKGDGALQTLVTDITSEGKIRSYARYDEQAVAEITQDEIKERGSVPTLLKSGYISFTIDINGGTDRYQGSVELQGKNIADCALQYFKQSEQIDTVLKIAVDTSNGVENIKAAGIMLQQMPAFGGNKIGLSKSPEDIREEWNTDVILLSSLKNSEMTSDKISADKLLYMIYNEQEITVFDEKTLSFACRCSKERIKAVLASFNENDFNEVFKNGKTEVACEFCGEKYEITKEEAQAVRGAN